MRFEEIGLIGNGQFAAHVARSGSAVWWRHFVLTWGTQIEESLAPVFADDRPRDEQTPQALDLLVRLTRKAIAVTEMPDAGIREHRETWEHQGARSPLGLLSEDYAPGVALWGNYPQAYSHVGLIHAAFEASPAWKDVL